MKTAKIDGQKVAELVALALRAKQEVNNARLIEWADYARRHKALLIISPGGEPLPIDGETVFLRLDGIPHTPKD